MKDTKEIRSLLIHWGLHLLESWRNDALFISPGFHGQALLVQLGRGAGAEGDNSLT